LTEFIEALQRVQSKIDYSDASLDRG